MMAQSFYERCSWFQSDLREKTSCRRGCCDLWRFCRIRPHILDFPPGSPCVHEAVKLLDELLADGGCARAVSCRCQDSLQDSFSVAAALSSAFLPRRHEDECRPRGASRCRLLRGLFFQMDLMRHWHKMTTVGPWIQDLLEVCAAGLVSRPRGLCLSCRGRQAVLSEVSAGKTHKPSHRQAAAVQRSEERRAAANIFTEYLCDPEKRGDNDLLGAEERTGHRLKPGLLSSAPHGLLSSARQLKNSLKKDLETHQLYLGAIETRLSGLERRAQDVTKRLERANLELEAIKQGSVALQTLVDEPIPSPVTELVDGLWEDLLQSGVTGQSARPGLCRRKDPERRGGRDHPAGGSSVQAREDVRSGLSSCQRHVDVLLQQITWQIDQMESDIKVTSALRHNAR
ncbi:uncharacterized protein LOC143814942 isoform X2 [Ranitomeya variabilis]|uniref:uncharacterized protein LOC143814942 isoform X2 n=1 Tax=Ranitomeya variabilis TaxID=490064 RepID=UPI004057C8C8